VLCLRASSAGNGQPVALFRFRAGLGHSWCCRGLAAGPAVDPPVEAAKANRHGVRDALMILMAYRHSLRASEVTDLTWEQIDFDRGKLLGSSAGYRQPTP
jgi:hypothetical protein